MNKIVNTFVFMSVLFLGYSTKVDAHCQIPCGIYADHAQVQAMLVDVATIEKAAKMIAELAGKSDAQSKQQLVRWVTNKEQHAQKIIASISDYFLTQRVKASQKDYSVRLIKHHTVIVNAMKAKQNADGNAAALMASVKALLAYYPAPAHKH